MNSIFKYNYYIYNVINFDTNMLLYQTDDYEYAKSYINMIKPDYTKNVGIQQIHTIARIIK